MGPRITTVQLDRRGGRVVIGFRDDRAGLDARSLIDGSNYAFTRARSRTSTLTPSTSSQPTTLAAKAR